MHLNGFPFRTLTLLNFFVVIFLLLNSSAVPSSIISRESKHCPGFWVLGPGSCVLCPEFCILSPSSVWVRVAPAVD